MAFSYSTYPQYTINYNLNCNELECNKIKCDEIQGPIDNTFFFTNTTTGSAFQSSFTLNYKIVGDLITISIPTIINVNAQTSSVIEYRPLLPLNIRPLYNKAYVIPIFNSVDSLVPSWIGLLKIQSNGALVIVPYSSTPNNGLSNFISGLYGGFLGGTYTYDRLK